MSKGEGLMIVKGIRRGLSLLLLFCFLAVGITPFVTKADEISELKASIQKKQEAIKEAESLKKELQTCYDIFYIS